jgi:SAM-dependent MidA family methyltransferase
MADSLRTELQERIRSSGPMPFAAFMKHALYHPRHGYYATRVPGHGGDYRTAPSITPWFGRLVAGELHRIWDALGRPEPFWVVEVGGGLGDLAAGAMEAAGPLSGALRWRFIERFERVREWQRRRLGPSVRSVEWSSVLGDAPGVVGCILGNEVLDNFPVHVLEIGAADVQEVYVDVDGDRFVERLGPPSDPALSAFAGRGARSVADPVRLEASLELEGWCRQASRALERGYLLLVDYGGVEPDLWLEHPEGTVVTHGPPELGPSPLEDPGRKDITAQVNFSAVARAALGAGFCP